jgi:SAM-dependent methyltransferase
MKGHVLEIGNGRVGRRGCFQPPVEEARVWIYLDLREKLRPHLRGNVENLPLKNASFDTVVCLEMLEYVTDPQKALSEIRRVLKPDGTLILSTPFLHRADTPQDYWRFTEQGLRLLLQKSGFEVVWLKGQGNALGVAVNILKYTLYIQRNRMVRYFLDWLTRPLFYLMLKLDAVSARHQPELATFSTGYLIVARKREEQQLPYG